MISHRGGGIRWISSVPCGGRRRKRSIRSSDGYLGTFRTRRDDRLLDSLKTRANQRSYQRGVHKGERIDQADYFWPAAWRPDRGLQTEAVGLRQTPVEVIPDRLPPAAAVMFPRGANSLVTLNRTPRVVDPVRVMQLRRLAPTWGP